MSITQDLMLDTLSYIARLLVTATLRQVSEKHVLSSGHKFY